MSKLSDRVQLRVRSEWPGFRKFDRHGETLIPPVRAGGATDALITFMASVVDAEVAELEKANDDLKDQLWSVKHEQHRFDPFEGQEDG